MSLISQLITIFFGPRLKLPGRAQIKGLFSEKLVSLNLKRLSAEYHVIDNVLIQSGGHSTQIDHIVVSPYGIFVIETKGYKGNIYGSEDAEYWSQCLYRKTNKLYSPIRQNEGHVTCLKHLLAGEGILPIIPITVFNNNAKLHLTLRNSIVVNRRRLQRTIAQYRNVVISDVQKSRIINVINQLRSYGNDAQKRHVTQAKISKNNSQNLINSGICPRCGGLLVKRIGKYGKFYGCSNYPQCRFISKV